MSKKEFKKKEKKPVSEEKKEKIPEKPKQQKPEFKEIIESKENSKKTIMDLKLELEAILFSSARRMTIQELAQVMRIRTDRVKKAYIALKKDYEDRNASLLLVEEGDGYKLTTKERFFPLVQKIVTETELTKAVMETLAVIAFKHPTLQAEIIKIRSNKAYDHLSQLEELGYITRTVHGRTKKISLTPKFFQYFDLPEEKVKEAFSGLEAVEKVIIQKEEEHRKLKEEAKKKEKEMQEKVKQDKEKMEKLGDLEVIDEPNASIREEEGKVMLGDLEIFDEPKEKKPEEVEEEKEGEEPEEEKEKPEEKEESEDIEKAPEEKKPPKEEKEIPKEIPKKEEISDEDAEKKYKKFVEGLKEGEEDVEAKAAKIKFKKTEKPLVTGSQEDIDKEVEKMLHPETDTEDVKTPKLSGIPEHEKKKKTEEKKVKSEEPKGLLEAAGINTKKLKPKKPKKEK